MRKLLLSALALFMSIVSQAQVINTVAGGGLGDGISATISPVNSPQATAVDAAGNLFIADAGNCRIRKVDATTGTITTVAGNGTIGYSGDGDAATSAKLNYPTSVAIDAAGNLYIADQQNNRIRKVDATTGIISTVAGNGTAGFSGDGGAATLATISYPYAVTIDAAGNLFIAEANNNRIRKVDATTGTITTVAGNGTYGYSGNGGAATSAQLNYPKGVAIDAAGNIFIADSYNRCIRKVDATTGIISTVAGNGTSGYSGDGGAATSAQLNNPNGVAIDAAGNLFIADYNNQRIRKVDATTGIISTVAGNGNSGFSGDGGVATSATLKYPTGITIDATGDLFIADGGNYRIRKINTTSGIISTVAGNGTTGLFGDGGAATSAMLSFSSGVELDAARNLYISDNENNCIRKVTAATGIITTVAGNGTSGYSGDGDAATSATLNYPINVTLDAAGNLFIADAGNNRIRKVDATSGIITTVAGNGTRGYSGDGDAATSAMLNNPSDVTIDAAGNLFIADINNSCIRKVDAITGIISTVAGNSNSGFSGDGGGATSAMLNNPSGVIFDAAGNLFIADAANQRIRKVDAATGIISTVAGNGTGGYTGDGDAATSATINYPKGVDIDAAGNLFIVDALNSCIRKVDAITGIISTVAGNGTAGLSGDGGDAILAQLYFPLGVTIDAAGNLFIADYGNSRIRKVYTIIPITVTANASQSKAYGSADPTLTYSVSPALQSGDAFTGALSRAAGENVGSYAISQGTLSAEANYAITFVPANFTVNKATLDVTADNATRVKGEANPAFTLTYNGFVGSDDASVIDVPPTATCSANAASAIGDYDIVLAGGSDNNYDLVLHNGTLTVTPATGIAPNDLSTIGTYPNPTNGTFYVTNVPAGTVISVYTSAGQLVKTTTTTMDAQNIDIQSLPAGMYLVKLIGSSVAKTLRVMKQ